MSGLNRKRLLGAGINGLNKNQWLTQGLTACSRTAGRFDVGTGDRAGAGIDGRSDENTQDIEEGP